MPIECAAKRLLSKLLLGRSRRAAVERPPPCSSSTCRFLHARKGETSLIHTTQTPPLSTPPPSLPPSLPSFLLFYPIFYTPTRFLFTSLNLPPSSHHQQEDRTALRSFRLMRTAVLAMEDRKRPVPHEPSDDPSPPFKRPALNSASSSAQQMQQNNHQLPQSQEDVIVSGHFLHFAPLRTYPPTPDFPFPWPPLFLREPSHLHITPELTLDIL